MTAEDPEDVAMQMIADQQRITDIGDNIRELQYLLVPQYEAQAERLKQLYLHEARRIENADDSDAKKGVARLHSEIADGHALINPLITGIELLQKARTLLGG